MLKHIPTGQPSSAGSKNQNNHHHHHNNHLHNHNNDDYNINQTMSSTLHHQHYGSGSTNSARIPRQYNDTSIYDSLVHPLSRLNGLQQTPSSSVHRHPLNHSQLSVNNLSSRFNHSHPLNLSTLSTSKHSIDSVSPVVSNGNSNFHHHHHHHQQFGVNHQHNQGMNLNTSQMINERTIHVNGGLDISRLSRLPSCTTPSPPAPLTSGTGIKLAPVSQHAPVSQQSQVATIEGTMTNNVPPVQDTSWSSFCLKGRINNHNGDKTPETGVREMLTFLGLLCLVSLLLAMLSHIFLLKISPVSTVAIGNSLISPEEYTIVYEVTLALCALALSLNLCCLLVCAIQFMFAMKLVKSSYNQNRTNMYLQKSSASRMCAVGGFFVSIPVFLTGMILYTFIQFHSTPAIVMSVFIGLGIIFCGCAMVHNVFVWQREKTNAVKKLARAQCEAAVQLQRQQQSQQFSQRQPHQQYMTTNRILSSTIPRDNCLTKSKNSTLPMNSRGKQNETQLKKVHDINHHHNHTDNQYRNEQMLPALCLPILSGSPVVRNHSNIDVHRVPTSPSATPADDNSPTNPISPINKSFSRSHHNLQREISGSVSPGLPAATLDLSSATTTDNSPHELSTLV
ncbi:hypothetical protein PV327_010008 [Microctonus hyperodae]|uniref:Uncharacterized protein n=1 Tax=Microctonus hyperodae TaxID=165561 RepID=A0AA39F261_MICHY|nr:hypothetical protein PV327_010008 [Microctonus hyperodae]